MGLSDFFHYPRGRGYYSGYGHDEDLARELFRPAQLPPTPQIGKRENLQLLLGSLSAALGNYDRIGGLGQAIAQAGAVYQQQKAQTLAAAFERAQEEARQQREDELYQLRRQEYEQKLADTKAEAEQAAADKAAAQEAAQRTRAAKTEEVNRLDLPAHVIDLPDRDYEDVVTRRREALEPKEPTLREIGPGGATLLSLGPNNEIISRTDIPPTSPSGKPLTREEKFLLDQGYNPADPLSIERYKRDQGFVSGSGGLTASGQLDLIQSVARSIVESSKSGVEDKPTISYADALQQAKQQVDGFIKTFDFNKPPVGVRGQSIGGIQVPEKGNQSSNAIGDMQIIRTPRYGKMDEADKAAMSKVLEVINRLPKEKQRQALELAWNEKLPNGQHKPWSMIWAEMQAP